MTEQPEHSEALDGADGKPFKAGENVYAGLAKAPESEDAQTPETETEKPLEREDVEALMRKAGELQGIHEVERGLEDNIIAAGLQTMADRYGADKLLNALQSRDPNPTSMADVVATLAPDKQERKALYAAIEQEPMDELAGRLNDTLGGIATGGDEGVDALERERHFELLNIKEGKPTDAANSLLHGNFNNLLKDHPQLVENFQQTNDTLKLLGDIRAVYQSEYDKFTGELERTKSKLEELVSVGEAEVGELQTLSADISSDEMARLEERKKAAKSTGAQAMIQGLLDKRAEEAEAARNELAQKLAGVRAKVLSDLGADNIYKVSVYAPAKPRPTHPPYNN